MAQSKHEIQSLLARANSSPRHRFGQNFMIDQNLVRRIADAAEIAPGDWVIEVGPGTGTLTEELLARGGRVIAVEIDRDLAAMLRERFAQQENFSLVEGDALAGKHDLNPAIVKTIAEARAQGCACRLVANLPYNIASPLVIDLLIAGIDSLTFTVQKEVGERLRATAGSDAYGPLSVMAAMLSRVQVLRTLPPQAFWPAPKIESTLVRMDRADRLGADAVAFGSFVAGLFSQRRKTLRNALGRVLGDGGRVDADALLAAAGLDGGQRPETVAPEAIWSLFKSQR